MKLASHLRRRREWFLVPLLYAVVVAWVYRDLFRGKVGIGWDLIESYWPDLSFVAHELGRGNFPLWNPFERGGVPALADPQPGLFYPGQWLLGLLGAALGDTPWSLIQLKELSHHWLAATLLYLFLRTRQLPWQAALIGGLTLLVSEPWFDFKSNNFLQSAAYAPLIWMATDALIARPSWRRGAALAAALYLPAAVGSPPGYFYTLLLVLPYGGFRLGVHLAAELRDGAARDPARRAALVRLAGCLGLAALLVLATQLVMMLPVRQLLALSDRAVRTVDFAVGGECDGRIVMGSLITPYGPRAAHCGILAALLGLAALLRPTRDRGAPIFFLLASAFFVALGMGGQTPLLRWLVVNLPGFGMFRASCRYLVCHPVCLGALAAYGLSAVMDPRTRRWLGIVKLASLSLALLAGMAVLLVEHADSIKTRGIPWPALLAGAVVVAAVLALVLLPRRWALPLAGALPLLLSLEAIETLRRSPGFQQRPDEPAADRAKVSGLPGLFDLSYRVYDEFLLEQRAGSRLRLRELRGYTSIDPLSRLDYQQILGALSQPASLHVLGEYNVRYVLYGPHSTKGWTKKILPGAPDVVAPGRFRQVRPAIYEVVHPAPQVAWYGGALPVSRAQILPTLAGARDRAGVRRQVVLEAQAQEVMADRRLHRLAAIVDPPPAVPGKVTAFSTEEVSFTIDAPAEGVVVLNEMMFPGWKVEVDGREQSPLTVDFSLRGVVVSRGMHHIRWVFAPAGFSWQLGLWFLGLCTFIAAAGAAAHRHRSFLLASANGSTSP